MKVRDFFPAPVEDYTRALFMSMDDETFFYRTKQIIEADYFDRRICRNIRQKLLQRPGLQFALLKRKDRYRYSPILKELFHKKDTVFRHEIIKMAPELFDENDVDTMNQSELNLLFSHGNSRYLQSIVPSLYLKKLGLILNGAKLTLKVELAIRNRIEKLMDTIPGNNLKKDFIGRMIN